MHARCAARQQLGALQRRPRDTELQHRIGIVLDASAARRAAARGIVAPIFDVNRVIWLTLVTGMMPGDDRHGDAGGARPRDEVEVRAVVEEQVA